MMTAGGNSNQNVGSVYAFSEMKGGAIDDMVPQSNAKGAHGQSFVINQSTERMTDLGATQSQARGDGKHESPYVAVRKFIDCTDSNAKFHGSAEQSV